MNRFRQIFKGAKDLAASRVMEAEADHIGLLLMAEAGYDPIECIESWIHWQKELQIEYGDDVDADHEKSTHPSVSSQYQVQRCRC